MVTDTAANCLTGISQINPGPRSLWVFPMIILYLQAKSTPFTAQTSGFSHKLLRSKSLRSQKHVSIASRKPVSKRYKKNLACQAAVDGLVGLVRKKRNYDCFDGNRYNEVDDVEVLAYYVCLILLQGI